MQISEFRIVPQGLHPLLIGMDCDQLRHVSGVEPTVTASRLANEENLTYPDARVSVRNGRVVEVGLAPPATVLFEGQPLFSDEAIWRKLVELDGNTREVLGFLVLTRLRLTLGGFHNRDTSQLSITAFEEGRWDRLEGEMKPFKL